MPSADSQNAMAGKAEITALIQEISAQSEKWSRDEPEARETLIELARNLVTSLQTPMESVLWMLWAEPTRSMAARVALDLKMFDTLVTDGGRPKTCSELAKPCEASPVLVHRIARQLAALQMIDETGAGVYAPNRVTQALIIPKYRDGIRFCFDSGWPSFTAMPQFLSERKYQNPENPADGPFQYGHKTGNAWTWLGERPEVFQAFQSYVYGQRQDRPSWTDEGFYPVRDRLLDGARLDGDASTIVDLGGGVGHSLADFMEAVPEWKGKLVLQELGQVIEHAKAMNLSPRIELMAHDFFQPQPIKGARLYYLRNVLHDWTDEECRKILQQLKDVIEPGYSRILINDSVVSDFKPSWQHTSLDLFMMSLTSAKERTEREWHDLIESCGLKIVGIWSQGRGNESIIELSL